MCNQGHFYFSFSILVLFVTLTYNSKPIYTASLQNINTRIIENWQQIQCMFHSRWRHVGACLTVLSVLPSYPTVCYAIPCHASLAMPCHAMPRFALLTGSALLRACVPCYWPCHAMGLHTMLLVVLWYVMLCYAMLCYPILPYSTLPYPVLPYPSPFYPILCYPMLPYPILFHLIPSYPILTRLQLLELLW